MPTISTLLTFSAATVALLVVPGPSVVYVVTRSVEHGRWAGMLSMLGLETGALLHAIGAAAGLGVLLASSELAFSMVRYAGACYLLHLAARQLRNRRSSVDGPTQAAPASGLRLYLDGILVDLLNPKTALFFIAFLPQFVDPTRGQATTQFLALGLCFVALATLTDGAYAIVAGGLAGRISRSTGAKRCIGVTTGGVYVGLAGLAAFG